MIRKYKINGVIGEKRFKQLPFGQTLDILRVFDQFKKESKRIHLSQKRQSYQKAIKEAVKLHNVKEYYCQFHCDDLCKDDSFEFFYKS